MFYKKETDKSTTSIKARFICGIRLLAICEKNPQNISAILNSQYHLQSNLTYLDKQNTLYELFEILNQVQTLSDTLYQDRDAWLTASWSRWYYKFIKCLKLDV